MDKLSLAQRFSRKPLYVQVRDVLAERVSANDLKSGTLLPNEQTLAHEFGVSSGTMRKALDLLEAQRILKRVQGRGTFVNDQTSGDLGVRYNNIRTPTGQHVESEVRQLRVIECTPSDMECSRLRVRPIEKVYRVQRLRFREGKPFLFEQVAMPASVFPGLAELTGFSYRIVVLAQQYGILLGKAEERLTVETASDKIAKSLQIPSHAPLLVLDRVVYSLQERPVEWRLGHCNISGYYYHAEFG